jgi:hypothetical protein
VFANGSFFAKVYPMATKGLAGQALKEFISELGVPDELTIDGSKEHNEKGTEFMKTCRKHDIRVTRMEAERSNQNPAEGVIREVQRKWFRIMIRKRVPQKLWDYGVQWTAQVMQRTSTEVGGLRGACPLEEVTGETINMSEHIDFGFYDHTSHKENAGLGETCVGRWLGVSHRVGSLMSHWILAKRGTVTSRSTVQRITILERQTDKSRKAIDEFDSEIRRMFKEDEDFGFEGSKANPEDWSECLQEDPEFQEEFDNIVNDPKVPEAKEDFDPHVYDDTHVNKPSKMLLLEAHIVLSLFFLHREVRRKRAGHA